MRKPIKDGDEALGALIYLAKLARGGGGYSLGGVRGWALSGDVESATGLRLSERFAALHRRGWVDREDVRAPGLQRPVWAFRITKTGLAALEPHGVPQPRQLRRPRLPRPPEVARQEFYVAEGPLLVMELLQDAGGSWWQELVTGEAGWRSAADMMDEVRQEDRALDRGPGEYRRFWGDDLVWLEKRGLIEVRRIVPEKRSRATVLYRMTELGRQARPLRWRAPRNV